MDDNSRITWGSLYKSVELYKAAVRLYTLPVFSWRKALGYSQDHKTFYDFARHGLLKLDAIDQQLQKQQFEFRPGVALEFNFNNKKRTLFIYPWEERLVDLTLYRMLNKKLNSWFSQDSYAYRFGRSGINTCQKKIDVALYALTPPVYVVKRDIKDYFNSIDHEILINKLKEIISPDDYLFNLLLARIKFKFFKNDQLQEADRGVPFGTAIACLFANIYLCECDNIFKQWPQISYFRYSDDILFFSKDKMALMDALTAFEAHIQQLKLVDKESQSRNLLFTLGQEKDSFFESTDRFKHLGLEYRANGLTGLSRDKFRKIGNLFKYAIRRKHKSIQRLKDTDKKIDLVISIMKKVMSEGIRNVAIIDYYLKHLKDEKQLRLLDRWLAEEALVAIVGGGHKRGNFRKLSYNSLREKGLPSLVHRRRLLIHQRIQSSFFIWKNYKIVQAQKGTAARSWEGKPS